MCVLTLSDKANIIFQGKYTGGARAKDRLIISKNKSNHGVTNSSGSVCALNTSDIGRNVAHRRYISNRYTSLKQRVNDPNGPEASCTVQSCSESDSL